ILMCMLFSFHSHAHPPDLPSFPTRRSSDLPGRAAHREAWRGRRNSGQWIHCGHSESRQTFCWLRCSPLPTPCEPTLKKRHAEERSEEYTSELQSLAYLVCRLLLEKKKKKNK